MLRNFFQFPYLHIWKIHDILLQMDSKKIISTNTFVIDSDSLEKTESRMIGFMICDDGTFYLHTTPPKASDTGTYVLIERKGDTISISQDTCGSFGLFLYKDGDRFLLSNSFYAIAEKIPEKLSLNKEHLLSFLYAKESSADDGETLAREISRIASDTSISITISTKEIHFFQKKSTCFSRSLQTKADFDLLDAWYFKWVRFYRSLAEKHLPLFADITGGLDTRVILSMLINAGIDITSTVPMANHTFVNLPKDADDMRIAKTISAKLHFPLNANVIHLEKTARQNSEDIFNITRSFPLEQSIYCKMSNVYYQTPTFAAKGLGSILKGSVSSWGKAWTGMQDVYTEYDTIADTFLDKQPSLSEKERDACKKSAHSKIRKQAKKILAGLSLDDEHSATYFYKRIWLEGRDAKKTLCNYLINFFIVTPFTDSLIQSFDYNPYGDDPLYLATQILSRYCPQLLEFEIENRSFSPKSIERAQALNQKYPPAMPAFDKIYGSEQTVYTEECEWEDLSAMLKAKLTDKDFTSRIDSLIGSELREAIIAESPAELHFKRPFRPYILLAAYEFLRLTDGV